MRWISEWADLSQNRRPEEITLNDLVREINAYIDRLEISQGIVLRITQSIDGPSTTRLVVDSKAIAAAVTNLVRNSYESHIRHSGREIPDAVQPAFSFSANSFIKVDVGLNSALGEL